ncbi:efflux transporter outer membrane subunit [Methylobacterium brachythecii]|uniref:NodT family efflux transporter outer membrane factor (OMF) lipoprotein n=1 Tax=Methylobacterium brachythecii TaxID=1176177 RepID=A0A7W6F8E9_9HYPH|nr:efflux transporter outer membrane subunit [Methylobacterium brachythecii]MBB3904369.1 NodT family efflux transporter outer membrane factor (OMF) lipoprotein [Methylobacterium brachythecii]GLS43702.1 RND transporter [Methylobacterium brachythecii]
MSVKLIRMVAALAVAATTSGCLVGPDYTRPSVETPLGFKEGGMREDSLAWVQKKKGWRAAQPNDGAVRGDWWRVFRDPTLDRLMRSVDVDNQNLRATVANYSQARALVAQSRSALFPTVIGAPTITRARSSGSERTTYSLQGQATWEPDLFGRIRRQLESDVASAQASAADIGLVRLGIQAELATTYLQLRYQDTLKKVLQENVEGYKRSLGIAENQYNAGVAARSDVITAQTQLQTTEAAVIATDVQRAVYEHALATLIGRPPSELNIPVGRLAQRPPAVPVGVPSDLLERRPDIAQSERLVQAQSEQIGVAVAAFFPTVTLSASSGFAGLTRDGIFSATNAAWSVAAAGSETLFDGGARSAAVQSARAGYDAAVATYRQTVLTAFGEVENDLSGIRILARQQVKQDEAVVSARKAVEITLNEYRAGTQNYTTVITAQALQVNNEVAALQVKLSRFTTAVDLIRAIGGGWDARSIPTGEELKDKALDLPVDHGQALRTEE